MSGSLLGPLLFFILFNLVRLATRYYGVAYGYSKGIDIVKDMGGGFLQKLTEGASILGLFVMGALVNKWTHVNIPLVVSRITDQTGKEHVTTVQTILDQLMPGLVPLLLTFACMWLLRKKVNPLWIIVGFFVIGIAGYACAAAHRDTGTQCCKYRTYGSPEDRVAYTSQRPHQTDFDTVDSTVVDLCAISTLFFQRQGYAENRRSHERLVMRWLST